MVTIELPYEAVDKIVVDQLRYGYCDMVNSLEKRKDGSGTPVFSHDRDVDIKQIKKHVKAFKLILSYYGEEV